MPTYHLANIVDDYLMKISHVIRGEEWLPSAPLHWLLYKFLGWEDQRPEFAHLPLILKPDGKGKLSKRDGDRLGFPVFPLNWIDPFTGEKSLGFRERGFFPEAFTNMIALLGWAGTEGKEILTMEEMINEFTIDRIHKAGAKFDFEKAKWFNHEYMKQKNGKELIPYIEPVLKEKGIVAAEDYLVKVCDAAKQRSTLIPDLWENAYYFFEAPEIFDVGVVKNKWNNGARENFELLQDALETLNDYALNSVDRFLHEFLERNNLKAGDILPVLRVMLIGTKNGPAVFEIISLLGKEETVKRIQRATVAFDNMMAVA
jgi:glutamyl-tRNA synthetase